jgi:gamma-glutamyl hydrolase
MFEWAPNTAVNHGPESIEANQYFANFFVSECRRSQHQFSSSTAEAQALIYNYNTTYTYTPGEISYTQCYFF